MRIGMFESFTTRHWFCADAKAVWSDQATLQAWLQVEAALAAEQAELGVIPPEAARVIAAQADAGHFDLDQLADEIAFAQHPLVPVLHRLESLCGEPAAGFIHWGATTQNIFDTATALQMHRSHRLLLKQLDAAQDWLADAVAAHRLTPMAGRTHGQHALPMTLGFKLAGWLDELERHRQRLDERIGPSFPACMGGAIGTHAATGEVGRAVEACLARALGLMPAGLAMRSSFDRAADYATALGAFAATAQKIGQDLVFMQRTEVAEVAEAFHHGKVGSSTMAQKRNPSTALLLVSLARLLRARVSLVLESMVRMDEGDSSSTNVADTVLPEMAILAVSVAKTLARLLRGLQWDAKALGRNLALTGGLIASEAVMMNLTRLMGRHQAHRVLYEAAQRAIETGLPFAQAIAGHPLLAGQLDPADLAAVEDAGRYVGESAALADDVLRRLQARRAQR